MLRLMRIQETTMILGEKEEKRRRPWVVVVDHQSKCWVEYLNSLPHLVDSSSMPSEKRSVVYDKRMGDHTSDEKLIGYEELKSQTEPKHRIEWVEQDGCC